MKKILILILCIFYVSSVYAIKIPDDAIRVRVISNSDSKYDRIIKKRVKKRLESYVFPLLKDASSSLEASDIINNNMDLIKKEIDKSMRGADYGYSVNFGYYYFPLKKYDHNNYSAGYYKSLYVTLGEGKGSNWWCVLYPPLCLMEASSSKRIQYKSFVKEFLSKVIKK